jgi:cell division cycle 20, cofactor of APC complex
VELWKHHRNKLIPQLTLGQHENGIISMAVSPDHNNLLSMGGDELLCLWQWCDINAKSSASALGHMEARSQLEFANLIR